MDVSARDQMALADAETLRAAGYDVEDDWTDCARPGPSWRAWRDSVAQRDRQLGALRSLRDLTRDDVRALLEALHA